MSALPPGRKLGYLCHWPAVESADILREVGAELTAESLYDHVLRATGDESAAQEAFNKRRAEELRSGQPVSR